MTSRPASVQLRSASAAPSLQGDAQGIADQGVRGSGARLPHLDTIQKAFGRHDVSGVQAHVGGEASEANAQLGAQGYATGNHVAFYQQPDLRLAAHEAAHTVQQKGGVQRKASVGQPGDPWEQHADAVADAVVQGRSAEALLDSGPGKGTPGVQRLPSIPAPIDPGGSETAQKDKPVTQGDLEELALWQSARNDAASSFDKALREVSAEAENFEEQAEKVDAPPLWQTLLKGALEVALGGILSGLASSIEDGLIEDGLKGIKKHALKGVTSSISKVGEIAGNSGIEQLKLQAKNEPNPALYVYYKSASKALSKEADEQDDHFRNANKTPYESGMSIKQMEQLKASNERVKDNAQELVMSNMLIGWLPMVAGDTIEECDLEDTSHQGVLGLIIAGSDNSPTQIVDAQVEGLNEELRGFMSGKPLSAFTKGKSVFGGKKEASVGTRIDLVIRTGEPSKSNAFKVTDDVKQKIYSCGAPRSHSNAIYFAVGMSHKGDTWYDSEASWSDDHHYGADAGRAFIDNVKSIEELVDELGALKLPTVGE